MAKASQWLTSRSKLADWLTNSETEKRGLAVLRQQAPGSTVHPLLLGLEEVCMGLQQLGRDSFALSRFTGVQTGEVPAGVISQWFGSLKQLSDWLTRNETENRSMVSLLAQTKHSAAHPLPMGLEEFSMGMQQLGRSSFLTSRNIAGDPSLELAIDDLATEDLAVIVDEESGEALGLA